MTDLAILRRLAEAATPGPWQSSGQNDSRSFLAQVFDCEGDGDSLATMDRPNGTANAAFIAAANPAMVLALLDRLAAAEAVIEKSKPLLRRAMDAWDDSLVPLANAIEAWDEASK